MPVVDLKSVKSKLLSLGVYHGIYGISGQICVVVPGVK